MQAARRRPSRTRCDRARRDSRTRTADEAPAGRRSARSTSATRRSSSLARRQRLALPRGPRADLAVARARRRSTRRLRRRRRRVACPRCAPAARGSASRRRATTSACAVEVARLAAAEVGEEDEAAGVGVLDQDHAARRPAVGADRRRGRRPWDPVRRAPRLQRTTAGIVRSDRSRARTRPTYFFLTFSSASFVARHVAASAVWPDGLDVLDLAVRPDEERPAFRHAGRRLSTP